MKTATTAYIAEMTEIEALLKRIKMAADDFLFANPENLHYGHVGSAANVKSQLKAICDQVYCEGEYAA